MEGERAQSRARGHSAESLSRLEEHRHDGSLHREHADPGVSIRRTRRAGPSLRSPRSRANCAVSLVADRIPVDATPLVTVVIPTYNWATVLPYSIGSALEQTMGDFELLVIGDGCTDESAEVVRAIDDARV